MGTESIRSTETIQLSGERRTVPYICGQMNEKVSGIERSMQSMAKKINGQGKALKRVEQKVFNGFGEKIVGMEKMIEQNRTDNEREHAQIEKDLGAIIKFGATALIMIFIALLSILGSIWLQSQIFDKPVEGVQLNAPIDPLIETTP